MGRTIRTYRQRLLELREHMTRVVRRAAPWLDLEPLWVSAHYHSAPGSTLPWPDTEAVSTLSILIELHKRLADLEEEVGLK